MISKSLKKTVGNRENWKKWKYSKKDSFKVIYILLTNICRIYATINLICPKTNFMEKLVQAVTIAKVELSKLNHQYSFLTSWKKQPREATLVAQV